jgi:hypothetical protein
MKSEKESLALSDGFHVLQPILQCAATADFTFRIGRCLPAWGTRSGPQLNTLKGHPNEGVLQEFTGPARFNPDESDRKVQVFAA